LSTTATLLLTQRLLGLACVLAAAEGIVARTRFPKQGLLSWQISRLQRPQLTVGRTGAVVGAVLGGRRIWLALAGRMLAGLVLIASTQRLLAASAAAVIVALMLLTHLGVPQGNDGSDQITLIIAVAVLLACIAPADSLAQRACLAFIAAQLLLSYVTAGASKLAGSTWRKGTAMADIASTHSYGSPAISRMLVRHPFVGRLGSWGTIAFELSMPGVLFLPSVAAPLLLCVAIGFHVAVAAVMGLNSFIPAFIAGYPAIVWLMQLLHN
jgi:hypothetical protein